MTNTSTGEHSAVYSTGSLKENVFFATFYTVIFTISVPCNALALWVFFHNKRNTPAKVFLLNLAMADMSYVLVLPLRVVYHVSGNHWFFGDVACRLVGFLFFINLYCSMYFMMWIGVDRLLATTLPLACQTLRKSANAKVISAIMWLLGICSMVPVLFKRQISTVYDSGMNRTVCNQLYLENSTSKALVSTAVAVTVPLVTLTISYILIFLKLRTMAFHERVSMQKKAVRMIVLTLITFLVAFVPYHVHRLVYIMHTSERAALSFGNRLTSALTCVSGVMDPVMYFFLANNYQKTLLQMCGRPANTQRSQSNS